MKTLHGFSFWSAGIILILALAICLAGCAQTSSQGTAVTTAPTASPGQKAPVQTAIAPTSPANLPYGVTISYPSDWERQDVLGTGVRDYGKNTVNIANFYSPNEVLGDTASYNSLSIDVDLDVKEDFDTYFNHATLALGKSYDPQMEAHSYTRKISGYDAYELDFQSKDVKGTYIFTNAGGLMYIFAFKGPTKPLSVSALQGEIEGMQKSITLNPPVPAVVKQR